MKKKEEIRIRDPFILPDKEKGVYYMYGTTALSEGISTGTSFSVYVTRDLENFEGPFTVFEGKEIGFWADRDYWAPEVHKYNGKYYLFAAFKSETRCRSMHILTADSPLGPFSPLTDTPITPADWECLDGTLWVEDGKPYMVFCHEWLQTEDGQICAVELTSDLKEAVGEPFLLFRASDNPETDAWVQGERTNCRVTDGPFLFSEDGKVKMIWSSFSKGKYAVLEAEADKIRGKWTHGKSRFTFDGGHAMIFEDFSGRKMIALHSPNVCPQERASFLPFK